MANYANLLATIAANIYTNGNNEVTAAMVKTAVDAMVASLGAGYQFMGVATPATSPGTPDYKCFYIASTPGTYTNFGGLVVNDGEVAVLKYDTAWSKIEQGLSIRFFQGGVSSSDGTDNDSPVALNTRIRSIYIPVDGKFELQVKEDFQFAVVFYDTDKTFLYSEGVWHSGKMEYEHTGYIRVTISKPGDAAIRSYEFYNFTFKEFGNLSCQIEAQNIQYVIGSLDSSSGNETTNAARLRSGFISVRGTIIIQTKSAGYNFGYFLYDENGKLLSTPASWFRVGQTISHNGLLRIIVKRSDEGAIAPSEGANVFVTSTPLRARSNPLAGKKLSVLGDSLSTFAGEIPAGYETWYSQSTINLANMWWRRLIDEQGMVKEVIDAWSGSRVSTGYSDTRVPMCDDSRLDNLGDPDVIVFFGGINDWRYLCELGDYHTTGAFDLTKFRQAYEYVLIQLLSRYPKAKLISCTMCQDGRTTDSATFPQENSVGFLHEYAESIRHLCKIYGVPCVDLFQYAGITYWNGQADSTNTPTADNHTTIDGLHPNAEGQTYIYEAVARIMIK